MKIDYYKFGEIVIDGQVYNRDLIILPDRIILNWRRREGHRLILDDIGKIQLSNIRCLIIGTGKFGLMKVDTQLLQKLAAEGIECYTEKTDKAVKIYNDLADIKKVAALFHLTC